MFVDVLDYDWRTEFSLEVELPPAYSEALMWESSPGGNNLKRKNENKATQMSHCNSVTSIHNRSLRITAPGQSLLQRTLRKSQSMRNFGQRISSTNPSNQNQDRIPNSVSFGHVIGQLEDRTTYCVHFDAERCIINVENNPLPKGYRPSQLYKHKCDSSMNQGGAENKQSLEGSSQGNQNNSEGTSNDLEGANKGAMGKRMKKSHSLLSSFKSTN